jgi:hypothetical protein
MTAGTGTAEAVVLVKALPHASSRHGETVCCAGIELSGRGGWLRLYPISFRYLDHAQRFGRWDIIRFDWSLPNDDRREESRRVDHATLEIVGSLRQSERERFLAAYEVTGLTLVASQGRTLALVRPREPRFIIEPKTPDELDDERAERATLHAQVELFPVRRLVPLEPCPYRFKYAYRIDDGSREGTCEDWETEATYFHWRNKYGEQRALVEMRRTFGERYPAEGMAFAMGTHSRFPDRWLIVGVLRFNEVQQAALL